MKLQNLTVIFIIIIVPIILILSLYISTGIRTIKYQSLYDTGLLTATHDAIYAFEMNIANEDLAGNPEIKRSIIKSSIKMFETSLANTCGISSYNVDEIEEYIPAIVFGMYDGFYLYAPSYNTQTKKYEHGLKNYVYYSESLDDGTVIRYSLDNYISVTTKVEDQYVIKEGYLINLDNLTISGDNVTYEGVNIKEESIDGISNTDGINYYKEAEKFTKWFLEEAKIQNKEKDGIEVTYLNIKSTNDPEDENSAFVQHKRKIIKENMESLLNSIITAYSNRIWGQNYKMPKFSEEDWEKVYSNISMATFFQGKKIGLTKYNGYCVLNSTNSNEYVNPNLMYFIEGEDDTNHYYHDIRCEEIKKSGNKLTGYKIGVFSKKKVEETNENGETTTKYEYDHEVLACYECVNGPLNIDKTVYKYISETSDDKIKTAYWTSLGRERYNQIHL